MPRRQRRGSSTKSLSAQERGAAWSSFGLTRSPTRSRRSGTARRTRRRHRARRRCSATGSSTARHARRAARAPSRRASTATTIGAGTTLGRARGRPADPRGAARGVPPRRRRRSSARSERSAATSCRRRAAGTGASSSPAACTAATAATRARASTASTRSSRTTSARRRTRPIPLPRCSRSARPSAPTGASCRSPSCTGCRPRTTVRRRRSRADELIVELDVPRPDASVYLKAMDRAALGVRARRRRGRALRRRVRLGLAGVAPIPWARSRRRDAAARHGVQGEDPRRAREARASGSRGVEPPPADALQLELAAVLEARCPTRRRGRSSSS